MAPAHRHDQQPRDHHVRASPPGAQGHDGIAGKAHRHRLGGHVLQDVAAGLGLPQRLHVAHGQDGSGAGHRNQQPDRQPGPQPVPPEQSVGDQRGRYVRAELERMDLVQEHGVAIHAVMLPGRGGAVPLSIRKDQRPVRDARPSSSESSQMVNGPALTSSTSMCAPKRPRSTAIPAAPSARQKSS